MEDGNNGHHPTEIISPHAPRPEETPRCPHCGSQPIQIAVTIIPMQGPIGPVFGALTTCSKCHNVIPMTPLNMPVPVPQQARIITPTGVRVKGLKQ